MIKLPSPLAAALCAGLALGSCDLADPPAVANPNLTEDNVLDTERPFRFWVQGLSTAEPGRDAFRASDVVLMERRPLRSGAQVLTFVTDRRPTFAGVDPYNTYIDRNSGDNVRPVN